MRKQKNTSTTQTKTQPVLHIIETGNQQAQLEMQIENHVNSIRALITRLQPVERQKYYDGFLSHLLAQPHNYPHEIQFRDANNCDYSHLSTTDLHLISELSVKIEEMYRLSQNDMYN